MNIQHSNLIQWQGNLHVEHERTTAWYIGAVCTLVALIAFSIITNSWSFLLVIIVTTIVYAFVHNKHIPPKKITINQEGLHIEQHTIAWKDCSAFWVINYHSHHELHLRLHSRWKNDFSVQTGDANIEEIRLFIQQFVPEDTERHEKKLDMIARLLKI